MKSSVLIGIIGLIGLVSFGAAPKQHVFDGSCASGVAISAPAGTAQTFACWVRVEGKGAGDKPYDRIVQTPDWYLHIISAEDGVEGMTFGYTGKHGKPVGRGTSSEPLFKTWQHVAVTFSKDGYKVYLNGRVMGKMPTYELPQTLRGGKAYLGNTWIGGARPLKGVIADAKFWTETLDDAAIAALAKTDPDGQPIRLPKSAGPSPSDRLPVIDITKDAARQVVIAEGAKDRYEGHPTTLLADDGRTMFCVWTTGHGGPCGQMARSDDAGLTWTRLDATLPDVYRRTHRNCPVLQKIKGPDGKTRYFIYSCKAKEGCGLGIMMSEDLGKTWVELPYQPQLSAGMPPTGVMELKDGTVALFGQVRKNSAVKTDRPSDDQAVWMAISKDGGRTYGEMRWIMQADRRNLCEPCCLRSPDGKSLVVIARENRHKGRSMMSFSDDEGKTWTTPVDTPWALTGDRHEGVLLPDGRYVIAFRDQAVGSETRGQFTAWVGTFDDLRNGRNGQFRIHLLKHHGLEGRWPGSPVDTGYPGVELLPDGTVVCTTYSRHFDDDRQSSVVSTRFKLDELQK